MQKTNDGLVMANRRLREDLDEVNSHYQELIAVSKEALKIKKKYRVTIYNVKTNHQRSTAAK